MGCGPVRGSREQIWDRNAVCDTGQPRGLGQVPTPVCIQFSPVTNGGNGSVCSGGLQAASRRASAVAGTQRT